MEVPPLEDHGTADLSRSPPEYASILPLRAVVLRVADALFRDDPAIWLASGSRYYLGLLPPLSVLGAETEPQRRLVARAVSAWHVSCIRLAGRIWGEYLRRVRPSVSVRDRRSRPPELPLPVHLAHLQDLRLA